VFSQIPVATRALLGANIVGFLLQSFLQLDGFALWPLSAPQFPPYSWSFQPWQLVTYAFLHGGFTHLAFNMLALYMFGAVIERLLGGKRFCVYYAVCVVGAALTQLVYTQLTHGTSPTMGASGGVFGLLLAYGLAFPHNRVMLLFPPIPMPAWLLVTLYGLMELYLGATGSRDGVAHFAHLGGAAAGFLLILFWRTDAGRRR
jgi:membrane associated rhomboid family serine protease